MNDVPVSKQFDDIYFSKKDGLAETAYIFLDGNNLPQAWQDKSQFTIFETGFGTGLNFLSAWKLFEQNAKEGQTLDFISVEKYPLKPKEILDALSHWSDEFGGRLAQLVEHYPIRAFGFHRIKISEKITLTLIFDDVDAALKNINTLIDCWFLDGFTPSKNPEMWSDTLFKEMARLSPDGASYATFTSASFVQRALEQNGFSVEKQKGFNYKRDMIKGVKTTSTVSPVAAVEKQQPKAVAIIGGGLAGASCAYVLKQYGFKPTIYEASNSLAHGASGNKVGLYNPRFSKLRDDLSDFFAPAYAQLIRTAQAAKGDIGFHPCGAIHLMNDAGKEERYRSMVEHWDWSADHAQIIDKKTASEIAGIPLDHDALYLPDSGSVSPYKLCHYYAADVEVKLNTFVHDITTLEEDAVILACGGQVTDFDCLKWLPIETVRGQISVLEETKATKNLKCNIHYGGYMSAAKDGLHSIGSTFEKWVDHKKVLDRNHDDNLNKLRENISHFADVDFKIESGRAGFRCATNDRFPVVGKVPLHKNTYVTVAFGSHGVVGSIAAAHHLADLLRGVTVSLPVNTQYALSPQRFVDRAKKKGRDII